MPFLWGLFIGAGFGIVVMAMCNMAGRADDLIEYRSRPGRGKDGFMECGKQNYLKFSRIRDLQKEVHQNAVDHGWWENERPAPEILCLIHSEVSEALEAYRKNDAENFAEELADIAIRLLDAAGGYGIDLEAEIVKKHEYNKTREYRHGGKAC